MCCGHFVFCCWDVSWCFSFKNEETIEMRRYEGRTGSDSHACGVSMQYLYPHGSSSQVWVGEEVLEVVEVVSVHS